MNVLAEIRRRFQRVLAEWVDQPDVLLEMIRPAQEPRFGDYQANCAMPLGKQLGRPPRDVAADLVRRVDLSDLCLPPEIAGPGFINLRLKDAWLAEQLEQAPSRLAPDRDTRVRSAHVRHRLLVAQRGQADARGPYPVHRYRRCALPHAAVCRPPRDQRQSSGRLGHPVRHDHLRLSPFWRPGRLWSPERSRTGAALPRGP